VDCLLAFQPPAQARQPRARLVGPRQESETSIVALIWRTLKPPGSEGRAHTCPTAPQRGEGLDDGQGDELWIKTSPKVRKLQRVLYRKAKAEPHWRFYSLYGELYRRDILSDALDQVIENRGAAGVDGFEAATLAKDTTVREVWLLALAEELRTKTYRPSPVRRVYIWKDQAKTKRRALGIPTAKDRVVQSAAAIVLQPIWEADFHDHSYAYRPKRRTHQAMDKVKEALLSGKVEVVDADLSSYFDLIPHRELLRLVAKRVSDGSLLRLIKAWLRAPIVEEDRETGCRKVLPNRCGTPQGGVV
jgi:RNA-directed DNA polymerase